MAAADDSRWFNEWEGEIVEGGKVEEDLGVEVGRVFEGGGGNGTALSIEAVGEVCGEGGGV